MDMKHDFPPQPEIRPDIRVEAAPRKVWLPELMAIMAIFIALWAALGAHYLSGGTGW